MPRIHVYCMSCLLIVAPVALATNVRLQITGLSGELQKNVRARLSTISSNDVLADDRFRLRVSEEVKEGLKALGYYEPQIDFELQYPPVVGKHPVLLTKITPGKPVKLVGQTVILRGGARIDEDYQKLLRKGKPPLGSILNHGDYEKFKSALSNLALRKGYFDGDYRKNQLNVSVERHEAFWELDYDSGERYRFGDITFSGSQIREDYLQNLVPFKKGDNYTSRGLSELNRRLSATGWFNSLVMVPEFDKGRRSKTLSLNGIVSPRIENTIESGVGYSTDVGPRVKANWKKPWVNDRGHSLSTSANISAPEQQLDFSYKIPLRKNPLEQYYLLQGGLKRTDLNDTKADSMTLSASRYWNSSSGWQRAINLRWSLDQFTQGSITNTTMLLYPSFSVNRTRSRGGMMPTWGDSQRYSLDFSKNTWGSDIDFVVVQLQNVWIRTLSDKHRFLLRGNLGWIETNNFQKVPPDLRFFAGGDRSIRGYKYKQISPYDDEGKLTGAAKLATGSLEYQHNLRGKWWWTVFVDSGEAINDIRQSNVKTGIGLGVSWQSPVGPIKLDIARPIYDGNAHDIQFYIGMGPEL